MKTIIYDYETMLKAGRLLNQLNVCGVQQARILSQIGDILDSGKVGEITEREEEDHDGSRNAQNDGKECVE